MFKNSAVLPVKLHFWINNRSSFLVEHNFDQITEIFCVCQIKYSWMWMSFWPQRPKPACALIYKPFSCSSLTNWYVCKIWNVCCCNCLRNVFQLCFMSLMAKLRHLYVFLCTVLLKDFCVLFRRKRNKKHKEIN